MRPRRFSIPVSGLSSVFGVGVADLQIETVWRHRVIALVGCGLNRFIAAGVYLRGQSSLLQRGLHLRWLERRDAERDVINDHALAAAEVIADDRAADAADTDLVLVAGVNHRLPAKECLIERDGSLVVRALT